ncbi:MAG: Lrp/AsnC family transcriptional regulator [Candidatus Bathyarchaeota archaeon]|nr:MAG: Lrp/AsnC family transcriptional regulator [Candidatus Bathyarchaeota archaeon]
MQLTAIDDMKYRLLRSLVHGNCVSVNIHRLSKILKRHRNTVRSRVEEIFENNVLNPPNFPFVGLFKEYPLLTLVWAELPYEEKVEKWFREDPNIFAAFRSRFSEYNTLLILYHKDITSYQLWREQLVTEQRIPLEDSSLQRSSTSFFSNQLRIKYDPNASVHLLEEEMRRKGHVSLGEYEVDKLSFRIIRLLAGGKCIKINENRLAKELGANRKTIIKRTQELMREGWISTPVCRFPNFFTPLNYILTIFKLDVRSGKQRFVQNIRNDPHITLAFDVREGKYNILLFGTFRDLEEELEWEIKQGLFLPRSIGHVDIQYFSPRSIVNVSQKSVSLGIIDRKYVYFRT